MRGDWLQSIDQLQAVYGALVANTIIENCDNKLILRCGASERGGTAQFASDLIDEREVEHVEATTSRSHSLHGKHTGRSTSTHLRRRPRRRFCRRYPDKAKRLGSALQRA